MVHVCLGSEELRHLRAASLSLLTSHPSSCVLRPSDPTQSSLSAGRQQQRNCSSWLVCWSKRLEGASRSRTRTPTSRLSLLGSRSLGQDRAREARSAAREFAPRLLLRVPWRRGAACSRRLIDRFRLSALAHGKMRGHAVTRPPVVQRSQQQLKARSACAMPPRVMAPSVAHRGSRLFVAMVLILALLASALPAAQARRRVLFSNGELHSLPAVPAAW